MENSVPRNKVTIGVILLLPGIFLMINIFFKKLILLMAALYVVIGFNIYIAIIFACNFLWIYCIYNFTNNNYISMMFDKLMIENIIVKFIVVLSFGYLCAVYMPA
jgi:hypothetical protein